MSTAPRSISKYIGTVDLNGNIIPKGDSQKKKSEAKLEAVEKLIQDFGDGFFISESIKKSEIFAHMSHIFARSEVTPLSRPRIENFLGDPSRSLLSC